MFLKRWLKNSVPFLQERSCRISVSCNLCGDWVLRLWVGFALGLGVLFLQTATVLSVSESATPSICINWCYCRARCILFGFNKGQRFFYLRWNITQFNYIRPDPLWLQYRKTILSQSHRGNSSRWNSSDAEPGIDSVNRVVNRNQWLNIYVSTVHCLDGTLKAGF